MRFRTEINASEFGVKNIEVGGDGNVNNFYAGKSTLRANEYSTGREGVWHTVLCDWGGVESWGWVVTAVHCSMAIEMNAGCSEFSGAWSSLWLADFECSHKSSYPVMNDDSWAVVDYLSSFWNTKHVHMTHIARSHRMLGPRLSVCQTIESVSVPVITSHRWHAAPQPCHVPPPKQTPAEVVWSIWFC